MQGSSLPRQGSLAVTNLRSSASEFRVSSLQPAQSARPAACSSSELSLLTCRWWETLNNEGRGSGSGHAHAGSRSGASARATVLASDSWKFQGPLECANHCIRHFPTPPYCCGTASCIMHHLEITSVRKSRICMKPHGVQDIIKAIKRNHFQHHHTSDSAETHPSTQLTSSCHPALRLSELLDFLAVLSPGPHSLARPPPLLQPPFQLASPREQRSQLKQGPRGDPKSSSISRCPSSSESNSWLSDMK